jgi:metal-sulfur cluster biosynthetic enzyme
MTVNETHTPDHSDLPQVDTSGAGSVGSQMTVTQDEVTEAMKDVVDPELGINVVDLGLVYDVHLDEGSNVVLDMTLTSAACPLTDVITDQTNQALEGIVNDVTINWVWMPPWGPDKITEDGRLERGRVRRSPLRPHPDHPRRRTVQQHPRRGAGGRRRGERQRLPHLDRRRAEAV